MPQGRMYYVMNAGALAISFIALSFLSVVGCAVYAWRDSKTAYKNWKG